MPNKNESFLASGKWTLGPIEWKSDDCGDYWGAEYFNKETGDRYGYVGTYYDLEENGRRASKEEQEMELRSWGFIE